MISQNIMIDKYKALHISQYLTIEVLTIVNNHWKTDWK